MSMTIDQLQIEVETNSEGAVKGLEKVKTTLQTIDKISKSSGLDTVYKKLKAISGLNFNNLKQLNKLGDTLKSVNDLTKKVDSLTSAVSKVPDTVGLTADSSEIVDATSDLDVMSQAVSETPKNVSLEVESSSVDAATSKTSRFRRVMDSVHAATSKVSAGLKNVTSRLKYAATAFEKTSKKASMLKQVLQIVLIYGGAFRAFMMLTQGVAEGLQNVAQYNNETATAMNKLSTMALYLKNSIGAALYPVIVAITPALQAMTNAIVRALNAFGQLASMLSGKTTYLKAKEYLKSYVDTAKGAANQIKKSFAGMDEITVIGNKESSSSGGSSEDYGSMFEEEKIDNPKLQALVPFFQGLGTVLSSCFNTIKGLANDYLYPWLVNLGNWCKENPDTLEKIGEGLGYIVVGLAGIAAAKGAVGILSAIIAPFKTLYKFLEKLGIFAGIAAFLKNIVFAFQAVAGGAATVGEAIQYAFSGSAGIFGGIGLAIGGLIGYVANLVEMFKEGESWSNILGAALGGLGAAGGAFLIAIGAGATVATGGIAALVVGIIALAGILTALVVNHWEEISTFFANLWTTISTFFVNIWTAISEFFSGVAVWVNDNILQPIIQFFTPFVEAICGFFQAIWSVVSTVFQAIWSVVSTVFMAIYEVVAHIIGTIIDIVVGLGQAIWAVITKVYEIVSTIVQMIWAVISWLFGLIWDFISGIATWVWDKALKPIVNFVGDLATKIVEKLTAIVNKIKTKVIDPVVSFFKDMIDKIVGFFKNVGIKVVDAISGAFKSVMNGVFTVVENVVNFFIKGLNGAIGIINKIPGVEIKKIDLLSIPRFETGGFPEDGLFMANHNELVGKFSNGKTAVANNNQIVDGIRSGVYDANQEQNNLLREQNRLLRQMLDRDNNGEINVSTITKAQNRMNRRHGKTIVPVGT